MAQLNLSQKAWIIGALMAGLFIGVNLFFVLISYTTTSSSECMKCHQDSEKLWKANKIHRQSITCIFCHTDCSSSQYAHLQIRLSNMSKELNKNCLKCHQNYMYEEIIAKTAVMAESLDDKAGKVIKVFGPWSLKDITCRGKFSCIVCHKNISHDRAFSPTNLPRADYCAECHYHSGKDSFCQVSPKPRLVFIKNGKKVISPGIR